MGTVYLAHDAELDRQVALKFLPQRFASDAAALTRFRREARAVAALNHPNIIDVYEIGTDDDVPFIAMPYIEGEILSDLVARGPLSVEQSVEIVHQICAGLDRAHSAGIVHRDIKPSNILVDKNGHVKILDFGLAKMDTATQLTADHSILGTVYYMSPEQARGDAIDGRSDIFSLRGSRRSVKGIWIDLKGQRTRKRSKARMLSSPSSVAVVSGGRTTSRGV